MLFRVPVCHLGEAVLMKKGNTKVTEPAVIFRGFAFLPSQAHSHRQSWSQSLMFLQKLRAAHLEGFYSQPHVAARGRGQSLSMPLFTEIRTCEKQFPTWFHVCVRHFSYSNWILAILKLCFLFSSSLRSSVTSVSV